MVKHRLQVPVALSRLSASEAASPGTSERQARYCFSQGPEHALASDILFAGFMAPAGSVSDSSGVPVMKKDPPFMIRRHETYIVKSRR